MVQYSSAQHEYFRYYSFDVNFDVNNTQSVYAVFFQIIYQTAYSTYDFKRVRKRLWLATSYSYFGLCMFFSTWCTSCKAAWDMIKVVNYGVLCVKKATRLNFSKMSVSLVFTCILSSAHKIINTHGWTALSFEKI